MEQVTTFQTLPLAEAPRKPKRAAHAEQPRPEMAHDAAPLPARCWTLGVWRRMANPLLKAVVLIALALPTSAQDLAAFDQTTGLW